MTSSMPQPQTLQTDIAQRLQRLPAPLLDALFSPRTAEHVRNIVEKHHIGNLGPLLAEAIGDVFLGLLHPNLFIRTFADRSQINIDKARRVALEVSSLIFAPVRNDLLKIYRIPPSTTPLGDMPAAEKPSLSPLKPLPPLQPLKPLSPLSPLNPSGLSPLSPLKPSGVPSISPPQPTAPPSGAGAPLAGGDPQKIPPMRLETPGPSPRRSPPPADESGPPPPTLKPLKPYDPSTPIDPLKRPPGVNRVGGLPPLPPPPPAIPPKPLGPVTPAPPPPARQPAPSSAGDVGRTVPAGSVASFPSFPPLAEKPFPPFGSGNPTKGPALPPPHPQPVKPSNPPPAPPPPPPSPDESRRTSGEGGPPSPKPQALGGNTVDLRNTNLGTNKDHE